MLGAWRAVFVVMLAGMGGWAREEDRKLDVKILDPHDLSLVQGSFQLVFEVTGGDNLEAGSFATVLLNNQEAANFSLTKVPEQRLKLDISRMKQMVYDCVVIILGPQSKYLGVFDVITLGVLQDPNDDPPSNDSGREWKEDEVKESLRRGRVVSEGRKEHAEEIFHAMSEDRATGDGLECGVKSEDSHLRAFGGLLQLWQGRRASSDCLSPSVDGSRTGEFGGQSGNSFHQEMISLAQGEADQERYQQVERLHHELYQAMREASPDDPAMGMEGTSGQLYEQTLLYHILSLSKDIRTGFGAGHSAVTWLSGNDDSHVVSFDLAKLKGQAVGEELLTARFPGRLQVIHGDSSWTVPEFISAHPDLKCDLVHVDGGHFDFVPWNDIVELGRASHESTVVVVDDAPSLGDVARAVKVAEAHGILFEVGCWNAVGYDNNTKNRHLRGFCAYHFNVRAIMALRRMQ